MQQQLHHYDGHRTLCTADEKAVAARIGGHTWNIISNDEKHEIYMRESRNPDHFLDKEGRGSSCWFDRKRLVLAETGEVVRASGSAAMASTLKCPTSDAKDSARRRKMAMQHLCQATAGPDYGLYTALLSARDQDSRSSAAGSRATSRATSARESQGSRAKTGARIVSRAEWTPRRGEQMPAAKNPPAEHEMFGSLDQMACETHVNIRDAGFQDAIYSARRGKPVLHGTTAVQLAASLPAPRVARQGDEAPAGAPPPTQIKEAADRTRFSRHRLEPKCLRDATLNNAHETDRALRKDAFYVMPMLQAGSSSAKYDIVTNRQREYWY
mmetsp:Transcript_52788/g.123463  ORF Transcript_52788/g.123463 Transcript_52788/m.123463 type:complete len:326 (-) Transcript_52788:92-1069(-)